MMMVTKYKETDKHTPSFVMFFLMSHGDRDGQFLLSYDDPECQKYAWRSVPKDIIKPIQEAYEQIPKIFMIQTCRGGNVREALLKMSGSGGGDQFVPPPNPLDYIPPASGTLILYPCGEGEEAYGSFLVDAFFYCIENLRKALESKARPQEIVEKVNGMLHGHGMEVCLEDLMDGWLMDICRKTSDRVAKKYMIERLYK